MLTHSPCASRWHSASLKEPRGELFHRRIAAPFAIGSDLLMVRIERREIHDVARQIADLNDLRCEAVEQNGTIGSGELNELAESLVIIMPQ